MKKQRFSTVSVVRTFGTIHGVDLRSVGLVLVGAAQHIGQGVDFGSPAPARATDRLGLAPPLWMACP